MSKATPSTGVNEISENNTSKILACASLIVIAYLHWILYIVYDSIFYPVDHSEMVMFIGLILTVLAIIGFVGVIWYGFAKGIVDRIRTSKNE